VTGPTGATGPSSAAVVTTGTAMNLLTVADADTTASVTCPGSKVVYGGGAVITSVGGQAVLKSSFANGAPSFSTQVWTVVAHNIGAVTSGTVTPYAVCGNP
jgi:hypothetical protein